MKKQIFLFFYCLLFSLFCFSQTVKVDSLFHLLKTTKIDTVKVNAYYELAINGLEDDNYDTAIYYSGKALDIANKANFKKGIGNAHHIIGLACFNKGSYADALKNYFISLKVRNEIGDKMAASASYNNIGIVFINQGDYLKALENYFKSLKLKEELKDKKGVAVTYSNIGVVYDYQGNMEDALKFHEKSLKMRLELNDKAGIATSYNNIGYIHESKGTYSEAFKFHNKALKIREELSDKKGISASFNNIGNVYMLEKKFNDAVFYFSKAYAIKVQINDRRGIAICSGNLGNAFHKLGDNIKSKKYQLMSLEVSKEIGNKELIKNSFKNLSLVDSATGNYKQAFQNYKMFIECRDSLVNEENQKKIIRQHMQYDFDKKQTADSIKNVEQAKHETLKHEQEIKQQRIYTYGGVVGFLLMLIVAGVSFRAFKSKQKANLIIEEQKLLVEEKQKDILDSIRYAKRIQQSLLPTEKYIERSLKRLND